MSTDYRQKSYLEEYKNWHHPVWRDYAGYNFSRKIWVKHKKMTFPLLEEDLFDTFLFVDFI